MNNLSLVSVFAAFLFTAGVSIAEPRPENDRANWPHVEVKLSSHTALKDLFDAGLRPYRFPQLETNLLECKHLYITFIQSDGKRLPSYEAELAQIHVLADGRVTTIELRNHRLTVADARAEMRRWLSLGTMPPRDARQLDHFFEKVEANYTGYDNPGSDDDDRFGVRWKDQDDVAYSLGFLKAMNQLHPVSVAMTIGMPRPPGIMQFSKVPIPPPPGYEDANMQAPKDFGPDSPISEAEEKAIADARTTPKYIQSGSEKPRPPPTRVSPAQIEDAAEKTPSWVWIAGALGSIGLIWGGVKYIQKRG